MFTPTQKAKLDAIAQQMAKKQQQLEQLLAQRSSEPQAGDIYMFKYTPAWHWVILKPELRQRFVIIPADNFPLVGSTDVKLPEKALCSPLTLRCATSLVLSSGDFAQGIRVGVLEDWHLQRVMDKYAQIAAQKILSPPAQQRVDADLDYLDWSAQIAAGKQVLLQGLRPNLKQSFKIQWFKSIFNMDLRWQLASVFSVILMVAVVSWHYINPAHHDISPLADSIQTVAQLDVSQQLLADYAVDKMFPHQYGFGAMSTSPLVTEVKNGWQAATAQLSGKITPTASENAFYQLGEWLLVILIASQHHYAQQLPTPFWQQQQQILKTLITDIQVIDAEDSNIILVLQALNKIEIILQTLQQNVTPYHIDELRHHVEDLISDLSKPT